MAPPHADLCAPHLPSTCRGRGLSLRRIARNVDDMELLLSITIFLAFGAAFVFINLIVGGLVRPSAPNPEKSAVYECGEPSIGTSWVQFDLRFYLVALFFLIFDVEIALFYPWAVAFGSAAEFAQDAGMTLVEYRQILFVNMLFFFFILVVGFAYEWRFGYLNWVRSAATTSLRVTYRPGIDLRQEARIDRGI
jgi:NADH-quinone oxidoreductase subunit A